MTIRIEAFAFVLVFASATEGVAHADDDTRAVAEQLVFDAIRQARRAIAIGPTAGVFSTFTPSSSELDGAVSFGLEFELFRSPVLSVDYIKDLVVGKVKARVARVIVERFAGVNPDAATMKRLALEVADEVKREVIAELRAKPRTLARPRLAIGTEGNYLFRTNDWITRLGFAIGVGPISLGPTFSVRFGDDIVTQLGGELAIHLLPTSSPRSPVIDVLLRGDFELHARDTNDDQIVLGVRVLLDVI